MHTIWKQLKNKPGLCFFILALAIRLYALSADPSAWQVQLSKDAKRYHALAVSVASGNGLEYDGYVARFSPLYPLFIAGIYKLYGLDRFYVLLFQCLLGAFFVFYVYRCGELLFSPKTAWVAALVAAAYWPLVSICLKLLSEALFIPLLLAGSYYTILALEQKRAALVITSAILLGLASLTRPVVLYFSAAVAIYLAWDFFLQKNRRILINLVLFLASLLLIIFPWALRNHAKLGKFIFTNTNTGMVLATGNMPREGKIFGFVLREENLEASKKYILDLPEIEQNRALKKMAIEQLKIHPESIPRLLLLKTLYFFSPFDWEVLGHEDGVFNPWFFWVLLFAIIGFLNLNWKPDHFVPAALILYFFALSLVTYASPRLRLPVDPFFILFAATGWVAAEKRFGSWRKTFILLSVVLASSAAGYIYSDCIKDFCRAVLVQAGIW